MPVDTPPIDTPPDTPPQMPSPEWRALPTRARKLFVLIHALGFGVTGGIVAMGGATLLASMFDHDGLFWVAIALGLVGGIASGAWWGDKQYRHTRWKLDNDGFALQRGRLWQRESRVPASRVQHLDLKHGPLERKYGLATLVIHTAGSKLNTVTVGGLDAADAERLRDHLADRIEADVDA